MQLPIIEVTPELLSFVNTMLPKVMLDEKIDDMDTAEKLVVHKFYLNNNFHKENIMK